MSHRPYLSVFHRQTSSHEILSRAGGGIAIAFDCASAQSGSVGLLANALVCLATSPDIVGRADPTAYCDVTAASIAKRYAETFDWIADRQRLAAKRLGLPVLVRGDSHLGMQGSVLKRQVKGIAYPISATASRRHGRHPGTAGAIAVPGGARAAGQP